MANFVKGKVGISLISISILITIPLWISNFNEPVTIKRWGNKLTWNDFQGFVPPFISHYASIHSKIYLEFDSSTSNYTAYAGQNNQRSWVKQSVGIGDSSVLNHEQYHFNITELHARFLNEYITNNPQIEPSIYKHRLTSIDDELNRMQDLYDEETNHSVNEDKQHQWQSKIDSLLLMHSIDSGWMLDKPLQEQLINISTNTRAVN